MYDNLFLLISRSQAPLSLIIPGMSEMLLVSLVTIEISSQIPYGCSGHK